MFPIVASPNEEEDIVIQPQLEHCVSRHHNAWMGKCHIHLYCIQVVIVLLHLAKQLENPPGSCSSNDDGAGCVKTTIHKKSLYHLDFLVMLCSMDGVGAETHGNRRLNQS